MPTLHLVPTHRNRWVIITQDDSQSFTEAQALAITRGEATIHEDHMGAMLSHPAWRTKFTDIIVHR